MKKPGCARREARGRGGLGKANMNMRCLMGIIAVAVVTTMFVLPADALLSASDRVRVAPQCISLNSI
jgi:hypothetical protein